MKNIITDGNVTCGKCGLEFDRNPGMKHCSNCFACTGCEIYYCPSCDNEIVVRQIKRAGTRSKKKAAGKP